jgi:hypothetical protein
VVPAVKQPGRHHVERFKILVDRSEHLLKVGQDGTGELVHQEGAVRIQNRVRGPQNGASQLRRHGGVGNPREYVVGPAQLEPRQSRNGIGRRAVDDV